MLQEIRYYPKEIYESACLEILIRLSSYLKVKNKSIHILSINPFLEMGQHANIHSKK
jgi:hypothetical protein